MSVSLEEVKAENVNGVIDCAIRVCFAGEMFQLVI